MNGYECVAEALSEAFGANLVAVVLFGDCPDAEETGGRRVLVIARDLPSGTLARHLAIEGALPDTCRGMLSFLAKTPSEIERQPSSLYLDVAVDGRVLYDPTNYAAQWLQNLQGLLEQEVHPAEGTDAYATLPSVREQISYLVRLAEGFLQEARSDREAGRWRACVCNSQLAVENAARVALARLGPLSYADSPATRLRQAMASEHLAPALRGQLERLAECVQILDPDLHAYCEHGDEGDARTPWELFAQPDAQQAVVLAERAVEVARAIGSAVSG
jgi:HEPN domain-containing protein